MTAATDINLQMTTPAVIRSSDGLARIVALSGGKDSTAMALRLAEVEPSEYEYCITPTERELPAMKSHWEKLECLLGRPLRRVPAPTLLDRIKEEHVASCDLIRSGIMAGYFAARMGIPLTNYLSAVEAEWDKLLAKNLASEVTQ